MTKAKAILKRYNIIELAFHFQIFVKTEYTQML